MRPGVSYSWDALPFCVRTQGVNRLSRPTKQCSAGHEARSIDMKQMKNILLAIDGEYEKEALAAEAEIVARDGQAHITVVGVMEPPSGEAGMDADRTRLRQWLAEQRQEQARDIAAEFVRREIPATVKQLDGKPCLEIIREAMRIDCDLIMKPAEGVSGVRQLLFGGADMQLFRLSPCPVWIFKPTRSTQLKTIVVAVDLLPHDQERDALADKVLQWGKWLANQAGAQLHVVHAWALYGEMTLRGRSVLANTVDKLVRDEEQKHRQLFNEALARNGLDRNEVVEHFLNGEAKKLIPEIARAVEPDLLIMGTVGRTGIPGLFIGNTADSVLRQVDCSILAVKPDGFQTPVRAN